LFPNAKSQRTKISSSRIKDLENSDLDRYIKAEMEASLSESVDIAKTIKDSDDLQRSRKE
jgi:hypothetical protein